LETRLRWSADVSKNPTDDGGGDEYKQKIPAASNVNVVAAAAAANSDFGTIVVALCLFPSTFAIGYFLLLLLLLFPVSVRGLYRNTLPRYFGSIQFGLRLKLFYDFFTTI